MTSYPSSPSGPVAQEHPRGTEILVLGILSLVCCGLFTGIPAITMGKKANDLIAANPGVYSNGSLVKAGFVCGVIGTVLSVLGLLFYVVLAFVAAASSSS